jgi:hypothetical protein
MCEPCKVLAIQFKLISVNSCSLQCHLLASTKVTVTISVNGDGDSAMSHVQLQRESARRVLGVSRKVLTNYQPLPCRLWL